MGIRAKFLLVLIVFSVVPLLGFYGVSQQLLNRFGDEIYHIARVLVLQTASRELQDAAANYTRAVDRECRHIAAQLISYRDEINRILLQPTKRWPNENLWTKEQLAAQMPKSFRKLQNFVVGLASVHFYAPGGEVHTYPAGDAKAVPANPFPFHPGWDKEEPLWILPGSSEIDDGKGVVVTVGLQVQNIRGESSGVAAISLDIIELLEAVKPSSIWSQYMDSLLVTSASPGEQATTVPLVVGIRRHQSAKAQWQQERFFLRSPPSFAQEFNTLFAGSQYGERGYIAIPYNGMSSLWVYSESAIGLGIVHILAEREPLYKIARTSGRLGRWITLDSLLMVSAVVVVMVIVAAFRSRRMLEPFFTLVASFRSVSQGDFSSRLKFAARDERQMVAEAFNTMVVELEDGLRMRQGLEVAHEVQHNFLPQLDQVSKQLDIAAKIIYCEETGGDYIDVFPGNDDRICIVVGDVTGHGVGAALLMATARALIRGRYGLDSDLGRVLTSVNAKLTTDMRDSGRFVTLFMLEIAPSDGTLRWVRGGHDPAWIFRQGDGAITSLKGPGLALGVDGDFSYMENSSEPLAPGDVLVIGTDGIWETTNASGEQFGKKRFERIVARALRKSSEEISEEVLAAVNHFQGEQIPRDDVSLVVMKIVE